MEKAREIGHSAPSVINNTTRIIMVVIIIMATIAKGIITGSGGIFGGIMAMAVVAGTAGIQMRKIS